MTLICVVTRGCKPLCYKEAFQAIATHCCIQDLSPFFSFLSFLLPVVCSEGVIRSSIRICIREMSLSFWSVDSGLSEPFALLQKIGCFVSTNWYFLYDDGACQEGVFCIQELEYTTVVVSASRMMPYVLRSSSWHQTRALCSRSL